MSTYTTNAHLVNNPTCFTKQAAPSLNDVILTNTPKQCMKILNFNCGINDVHNFISVQFKGNLQQRKPVFKNYRSFKNISEENFISDLEKKMILTLYYWTVILILHILTLNLQSQKQSIHMLL
jgi:hypothetical protein